MSPENEVVITGLGVVSPIGIGIEAYWTAMLDLRSGVRPLTHFDPVALPLKIGAEVLGFDPKEYVKPRKSLKVMARDIQFGVTAADMACESAGLSPGTVEPERMGVVFGAEMMQCEPSDVAAAFRGCLVDGKFDFARWGTAAFEQIYPLWMLKYLPNMPACHIAIAHDARGPNNTIALGDVSSLLAIAEAARVIRRGHADVMVTGGTSSRVHPTTWVRHCISEFSRRSDDPAGASRPFDADRDGAVHGEGAAAFILERRTFAEARGARILARVVGQASAFESRHNGKPYCGQGIRHSIREALRKADLAAGDLGHVNAHGLSTTRDDAAEAQAIRAELGDVPVTAPKSVFGNLGAGGGAVEMLASVMALTQGVVPATLNYQRPDEVCPVNVIHRQPLRDAKPLALLLNQAATGQAAALVLASA
jgi:3-oxoacyl-[acyl-carrier-protein] synthase II